MKKFARGRGMTFGMKNTVANRAGRHITNVEQPGEFSRTLAEFLGGLPS